MPDDQTPPTEETPSAAPAEPETANTSDTTSDDATAPTTAPAHTAASETVTVVSSAPAYEPQLTGANGWLVRNQWATLLAAAVIAVFVGGITGICVSSSNDRQHHWGHHGHGQNFGGGYGPMMGGQAPGSNMLPGHRQGYGPYPPSTSGTPGEKPLPNYQKKRQEPGRINPYQDAIPGQSGSTAPDSSSSSGHRNPYQDLQSGNSVPPDTQSDAQPR